MFALVKVADHFVGAALVLPHYTIGLVYLLCAFVMRGRFVSDNLEKHKWDFVCCQHKSVTSTSCSKRLLFFFCTVISLVVIITDMILYYCANQHIPELKSFPQPGFHAALGRFFFCSAVFSLHKQCLQSESALIKGTNLSRSNQVAALGRAADNSGLFDQKYIIFSRLAAWMPLSGARK